MARGYSSQGRLKAENFFKILLLSTLVISIIVLTTYLTKEGTSLDIREKAVYLTPSVSPSPTPRPYSYLLNVEGCSLRETASSEETCQGRVSWLTRGFTLPRIYRTWGTSVIYISTDPNGAQKFTLRNSEPANCTTFFLYDGTQFREQKEACITLIP
jgi:hypothetical protein